MTIWFYETKSRHATGAAETISCASPAGKRPTPVLLRDSAAVCSGIDTLMTLVLPSQSFALELVTEGLDNSVNTSPKSSIVLQKRQQEALSCRVSPDVLHAGHVMAALIHRELAGDMDVVGTSELHGFRRAAGRESVEDLALDGLAREHRRDM